MSPRTTRLCLVAVALVSVAANVRAQQAPRAGALQETNVQLRERVKNLEGKIDALEGQLTHTQKELAEIKAMLRDLAKPKPPSPEPGKTPAATLSKQEVATLKEIAEQKPAPDSSFTQEEIAKLKTRLKKMPVLSSLAIDLYGFVRVDAAYDSRRTTGSNYALWVDTEQNRDTDDQFGITARHSRVGLKIQGPDAVGAQTSGLIEIDFDDTDSHSHNKASPVMRHAYMKLDWPEHGFSILAGQTWDVVSPLFPPTLSYSLAWQQGNIGYRRPQIRLTKVFELAEDVDLKLEAAAARTIGRMTPLTRVGARPGDTGEDTGFPTAQGRVGLTFPGIAGKATTIGLSGHWGEEEIDRDVFNNNRNVVTWSANIDANVPVTPWLTLKGEAWTGENLDAYLGGIGQGVVVGRFKEVSSHGGWAAASLTPSKKWKFNAGAGMDDPDNKDLRAAGSRTLNSVLFGNAWYSFNKAASVGLELSHLKTNYRGMRNGESIRAQLAFMYKF